MVKWKDLILPLLSYVTWSKFLDFSEFPFFPLKNEELISLSFRYDVKINLSNLYIECIKC